MFYLLIGQSVINKAMAACVNDNMLPSLSNAYNMTQSLFIKKSSQKVEAATKYQDSMNSSSKSKVYKIKSSRSSSTIKHSAIQQKSAVAESMHHAQNGQSGTLSPVKSPKAKQFASVDYRLINSKLSPVNMRKRLQSKKPTAISVFDTEFKIQDSSPVSRTTNRSSNFTEAVSQMMNRGMPHISSTIKQSKIVQETDERESEKTGSTASRISPIKLVIMKRADILSNMVNYPIKVSSGGKAVTDRQDLNDYFIDLVDVCFGSLTGKPKQLSEMSIGAPELLTYFTNNHKNLQIIKNDLIVERPVPVLYYRKYPDRKLLLLDLDETLIHCSGDLSQMSKFDQVVDFINRDGIPLTGLLNIRPYARQFLQSMSSKYEVVIFTASLKYYADRIIKILDPQRQSISEVFYRDTCCRTVNDKLVKDLTVFQNIPLSEMILVDNNMYCLWPQPQNGIPILNFEHNKADRELFKLESMLLYLENRKNIGGILQDRFKITQLANAPSLAQYLTQF